jgi:hypothetical protein
VEDRGSVKNLSFSVEVSAALFAHGRCLTPSEHGTDGTVLDLWTRGRLGTLPFIYFLNGGKKLCLSLLIKKKYLVN